MNFLELQTEVLRRLGEPITPSTAQAFAKIADVKVALNEGYECMSEASEWYEKATTLSIVSGLYYDLTSTGVLAGVDTMPILTLKWLWSNQNNRWMRQSTWRELDEEVYPVWESSIGEPDYWIMRGPWWLGLFPHRSSSLGSIRVIHTAMPTLLSADADTPGFPQEYHQGLISYALYDLYCQDKEWVKAKKHFIEYLAIQDGLIEYVGARAAAARLTSFGAVGIEGVYYE